MGGDQLASAAEELGLPDLYIRSVPHNLRGRPWRSGSNRSHGKLLDVAEMARRSAQTAASIPRQARKWRTRNAAFKPHLDPDQSALSGLDE